MPEEGSPSAPGSLAHSQGESIRCTVQSPKRNTESEPGETSIEALEHNANETSEELLSSYPSEDFTRLSVEYPPHRDPENAMEERSDGISDDLLDNDVGPEVRHTKKALSCVSTKSTVYMWIVPLSALIPAVSLVVWVVDASKRDRIFTSLAGSEVGGHLTQTQAKGIDFICSALLAPLLVAGLNLLWFACARVCVVNESAYSVPLQTLATASALSRGTYDPLQHFILLRGRTWRLAALGGIALSSALGASALANMIAYEVFIEQEHSNEDFSLRLLRDATIESPTSQTLYNFESDDLTTAAKSVSELLHGFEFAPATLDEEGGYIGVNSTSVSMTNIDRSVNTLSNVPGFRLSAECVPSHAPVMDVWPAHERYVTITTTRIVTAANEWSNDWGWGSASYSYFSGEEDGPASISSNWAFPAWDCGYTGCGDKFYIIYMLSGIHQQALHTGYGDVQPTNQYRAETGTDQGSMQVGPVTSWGLQCVLFQQQGLINYTRSPDLQWSMGTTSFDSSKTAIDSQLRDWQEAKLDGDWAPPQLGVVLFGRDPLKPCRTGPHKCLPTRNVSTSVGNYIYASDEIIRIIHNIAAENASRAAGHPEYYYNVTGTVNKQYYRITYVPVLLLVALVSIILAALLTTALMISVRNTVSWSWFRQVDFMRLVVDAVGGSLRHQDEHQFVKLSGASDDEILGWAREYSVLYVKVPNDQSQQSEDFNHVTQSSVQLVHRVNARVREGIKGLGI